jgi:hypothetical protein
MHEGGLVGGISRAGKSGLASGQSHAHVVILGGAKRISALGCHSNRGIGGVDLEEPKLKNLGARGSVEGWRREAGQGCAVERASTDAEAEKKEDRET